MNTMFAPLSASAMRVRSRMALSRPTTGSLPAPRPLSPSWMRLRVGIRANKFDVGQAGGRHVVDGIAAGAADADYFDHRLGLGILWVEQGRLLLMG
jgi:hypothetical protein